ncbi:F-box/kelch-repeat protein At3g18720 [Linum perenne]
MKIDDEIRAWGSLPHDLCISILERLFGQDILSYRSVCKHWRLTPKSQLKLINHPISEIVKHPFLFSIRRKSKILNNGAFYRLYSPSYSKTYLIDALDSRIGDSQIHCYNYGWLLLSCTSRRIFFLHPTTQSIIKLPLLIDTDRDDLRKSFTRMSFSAPPTSPDCVVLGFVDVYYSATDISFIRRGDSSWRRRQFSNKMEKKFKHHHRSSSSSKLLLYTKFRRLVPAISCKLKKYFDWSNLGAAPVFHNGEFYSLGSYGRLGVFNPRNKTWRVLDTQHAAADFDCQCEAYLMESPKRELISVVVGSMGDFVKVVKFNDRRQKWHMVTSLQDDAIFLSRTSCIVINCAELGVKGLENTIHFPRFLHNIRVDGDHQYNVFYSLSSKMFHTFEAAGYASRDLQHTKLALNCTWIVPHFQSFDDQQLNWASLVEHRGDEDDYTYMMMSLGELTFFRPNESTIRRMIGQRSSSSRKPWIIYPYETEDKQEKIAYVDLSSTGIEYYDSTSTNNVVFFVNEERLRRGSKVVAINDGRVFLMDAVQLVCTLLDTSSFTTYQLPSPTWNTVSNFHQHCSLLSKAVVLVFGTILNGEEWEGVAIFCRVGDDRWTTFKGPDILQAVSYEGKIYGINYDHEHEHTFVEIEVDQQNYGAYTVKVIKGIKLPIYERRGCTTIRYKFVESCGELLLFYIYFHGDDDKQEDIIADVKVFKLDVNNRRLQELEHFGDRAFFFAPALDCGFGCCASEFGLDANTIYYTSNADNKLYKYNYGDDSVSFSLYCPNINPPYWENKFVIYC